MTDDVIGKIVEGKVTNIANFGVFVSLGSEEGLVHISEVADEFVTNINDFVRIGDTIQVKVLSRNQKNKLELSIKQAKKLEEGQVVEKKIFTPPKKPADPTFEDRLNLFMKRSEERQIDIRRNLKNKQGISKRKK